MKSFTAALLVALVVCATLGETSAFIFDRCTNNCTQEAEALLCARTVFNIRRTFKNQCLLDFRNCWLPLWRFTKISDGHC